MAYDNFQNSPNLPVNGKSKRRSEDHLPRIFRTPSNSKFLGSTLDQMIQPGVVNKLNGYVGRKTAKAVTSSDIYVNDVSASRENYQLEPASVIKDDLDNVILYRDYNDYMNSLKNYNRSITDHNIVNEQEFYAWNPYIDWDKFTNFREYYWLPMGPQTISIAGRSTEVESTISIRLSDNLDSYSYIFTPDGETPNPVLTLYRGVTYKFDVDLPNHPITFKTKLTTDEEFNLDSSSIIVYDGIDIQGLEKGITTIELSTAAPDTLWYVAANDVNIHGRIEVKNIEDAAFLNVDEEIVGKKTYTSGNGIAFSNGMKIQFIGDVEPASYANKEFFVEGVGDEIKLIEQSNLTVATAFTDEITVNFDSLGFDQLPYSKAIGYPAHKDYIVINRDAKDGNLWSRHNRWFHRSVIEASAKANNQPVDIDETAQASRPIIEFNSGIRLFNFGTFAKQSIDLIDDFTTDVFSTIEGSLGYNVDGVDLADGQRVMFTNDADPLVKNRIFKVKFFTYDGTVIDDANVSGQRQITLVEENDSIPADGETVLVSNGTTYKGVTLHYKDNAWIKTQEKTKVNQAPLFDVFDENGYSFSDTSIYPSSTFTGTHMFSYKQGSGANDSELGFPLSYRNITNVGDIVFQSDLTVDDFTYVSNQNVITQKIVLGYLHLYSNLDSYVNKTGWEKVDSSSQFVIRQYVYDNTFTDILIDSYTDSFDYIDSMDIIVYKNNNLQIRDVDYVVEQHPANFAKINFTVDLEKDDIVLIKTNSDQPKTENGYYEFPYSLERNPSNDQLNDFTLGEINDHVATIIENTPSFKGQYPGNSNLRDLGKVSSNGRRFLQHSAPMNLPLYHITEKESNIVKSIKFAKTEYSRFKREFISLATTLGFDGTPKEHVDRIIQELNKSKTMSDVFYFSDMVPYSGNIATDHIVEDSDEIYYPLGKDFTLADASYEAVLVYLNDVQLVHGKDYTFNDEGYAVVTAAKTPNDVITVYEYDSTKGNYIPPTPTKLGLYPAFEPQKYVDTTYQTPQTVIQGHDGSITVAYEDYRDDLLLELERRIYNNLKVSYNASEFDILQVKPSYYRPNNITRSNIDKSLLSDFFQWTKLVTVDYTRQTFNRDNRFTYNYRSSFDDNNVALPGSWREIYKYYYDTDRPHTHPWEMLGETIQPTWWEDTYGPAPYTSENYLLWEDLEAGIMRHLNRRIEYKENYKRPGLTKIVPVNDCGDLVSPLEIGLVFNYSKELIERPWVFGDGGPVEAAWRRNSEFPFSMLIAYALNKPGKLFSAGFDRINQVRNKAGNLVYKPTGLRIRLEDLVYPQDLSDTTDVHTSGIINYVAEYTKTNVVTSYNEYKSRLSSIKNQLGFKLAGFTDKTKLKLILDSRTPLNKGNVFVPEENYQIVLNESSPIDLINYSGVVIERREEGFLIKGYSESRSFFLINPILKRTGDYTINVGGVSEDFVEWTSGNFYTAGTVVRNNSSYYRCTKNNQAAEFTEDNFAILPSLPMTGGRDVTIAKNFNVEKVEEVPYGTLYTTIQEVVDFLISYESYLKSKGFVFDYFNEEIGKVLDWKHSVREFAFWTLYDLDEGAVISLSPSASYLQLASNYSIVSDVTQGPNDYTLLQAAGTYLDINETSINRRDNDFVLYVNPDVTGSGVFYVELPMTQTEHVVLLDNETVFNDVIYDKTPGYRQERIKLLGYRTDEWTGSKNIPGFVYDDASATVWEPFKSYSVGSLVKFKQFYYVADDKVIGSEEFNESQWVKLPEKPRQGLLPNFEYKVNQFTDFYDLDSDNLDTEQQKFAQHLIGYQKRNYLENIINNSVSQYKFYQGMILEKGTVNAMSKLFNVLASTNKDSLEFYEEWAIKDGQYGAVDSFDEFEVKIDESKILVNPQPILLTSEVPTDATDTVYRIKPYEVFVPTKNYNNDPFPTKNVVTPYVNTAGYVHKDDASIIVESTDELIGTNLTEIANGSFVWVGNENRSWNILKHVTTDIEIDQVEIIGDDIFITAKQQIRNIEVGDLVGIYSVWNASVDPGTELDVPLADSTAVIQTINEYKDFNFVSKVTLVDTLTMVINSPDTQEFKDFAQDFDNTEVTGRISHFQTARFADIDKANSSLQKSFDEGTTIWIDSVDGTNNWKVLENSNLFDKEQEIEGPSTEDDTGFVYSETFASELTSNNSGNILVAGDPDSENGKLFVYKRTNRAKGFKLLQVIEPESYAAAGQKFGSSIELSEDGKWLIVGSPNASNVKTNYKDNFSFAADYDKNDIVFYKERLWKAKYDLPAVSAGVNFSTFSSVVQGVYELGQQTNASYSTPAIAVGNYSVRPGTNLSAFTDQVNHILVRAPKEMYNNTITDDSSDWEVKLDWNTLTYGNQYQDVPTEQQPFNGVYAGINESFIDDTHQIIDSIDVVIYFASMSVVPSVGEILQSSTGTGEVAYVHTDNQGKYVLYLKKVSGSLNTSDSIFRPTGEFVGDFTKQLDTDGEVYAGFWMINTPNYTPTLTSILSDTGKGLVYVDMSNDSTFGNYYYNILDTNTSVVDSENTKNSFIRILSSQGFPNANNTSGSILDSRWVIRAPKELTDTLSPLDTVNVYVNQLPNYTSGEFKDLTSIGLSAAATNKEVTVSALWDGYVKFRFTQFDTLGQPSEPQIGQTIRDKNTGATAIVQFYERDGVDITLFVSSVSGLWSKGELFGDTAEIEYLAITGSTNPVYQADRTLGDIQSVSIGSASNNIGKLIVVDTGADIELPSPVETSLEGAEYWFYSNRQVLGEPVSNDAPSILNSNWEQAYSIPADVDGTASSYTEQGMYSVYEFNGTVFSEYGSFITSDAQDYAHLGSNVKIRKKADTYKGFVVAAGNGASSLPGKLHFVNKGTYGDTAYDWEFSKFKAYKGAFDETVNYRTGDVVFVSSTRDVLYEAKTNLTPGAFDVNNWTLKEDYIDYVGFIPNNTSMVVINDSTAYSGILDNDRMETFANEFDVSRNGDVVVAKTTYENKPTAVVVYRNVQENYQYSQTVVTGDDSSSALDNNTFGMAHKLGISRDGVFIAVTAPLADTYHVNEGQVFIYKQVNGQFELFRTLENKSNSSGEQFGYNVQFNGDKLAVSARNGDAMIRTTFDNGNTTFDSGFTTFGYENEAQGIIYIYEELNNEFLLAQTVEVKDQKLVNFGKHVLLKDNSMFVGIPVKPQDDSTSYIGEIYSYRLRESNKPLWSVKRELQPAVDVSKIKEAYLYNTRTGQKIQSLDYIDPLQGKIAGAADQEISYKTNDDPAVYSIATNTLLQDEFNNTKTIILDAKSPWGADQVGKVWWDLTNARFLNPYQRDIVYSSQTWNVLFPGSTVDVYEWIESDITPAQHDALVEAQTRETNRNQLSGTTKYGDNAYVTNRVYDSISKTFSTKYYFWVKNKDTIPASNSRKLNVKQIASYIAEPMRNNIESISFLSSDRFVLNNVNKYLSSNDVALNVQFYTVEDQRTNVHTQYKIVSEGLETSQPTDDIVNKWFDSLIGYDNNLFPVPDPSIPVKYRYGTLSKPRQSWFINRLEALKQVIERTNLVLADNLIVDTKTLTPLFDTDAAPTLADGLYDLEVDDLDDLTDVRVEKLSPAVIKPIVEDGKIERVEIVEAGYGYKVAPKVVVFGSGTNASIDVTINSLGRVVSATVVNKGTNYKVSDTILSVRKFSVLVKSDSTISNKWSIYERDNASATWNRTKKQSYDTTLYWDYIDWYAEGYNSNTRIDHIVENSNSLINANVNRNEVVKINNIGTGGWLLLRRVDTTNNLDYTIDYETIGRQNGTIQFSSDLYLPPAFGYDSNSFDIRNYDFLPVFELRTILNTIKDNIFVNDLLGEFNKLFFASLRYVLSEQTSVDWLFKSSFVKAKHNVGELRKDITFNNDNLADYEEYIKEVKPFKSKIREYLSAYERLEPTRSFVTDFDLTPVYNITTNKLSHPESKINDSKIEILQEYVQDYPNKHWFENAGYEISAVNINDEGSKYRTAPVITISGGGGSGAELKAYIGTNGKLRKVEIVNSGSGYTSEPTVTLNNNLEEGGTPANISIELGNGLVRSLKTAMKFDRVARKFTITDIDTQETFTASGSNFEYTLKWPMQLYRDDITVTANGVELLSSEYSFENVVDTSKTYRRQLGKVTTSSALETGTVVVVSYKKSVDILNALDRINTHYTPKTGQLGKELAQLMTGIDYGGVEVKGVGFDQIQGWDNDAWYTSEWDAYDDTNDDEVFTFDESTVEITLSKPLEDGVQYNVYLNDVRLDDPQFDGSTVTENPNAIMRTLVGDGVTDTFYLDDFKLETIQADGNNTGVVINYDSSDKLVIRKSTSDGSYALNPNAIDTNLSGGDLNYGNAKGILAEDIVIDGDSFVTATNSSSVEEHVPGHVLDSVNIKVYELPTGSNSSVSTDIYYANGVKTDFTVNDTLANATQVIVRVNDELQYYQQDYSIDIDNKIVKFVTAPSDRSVVSINNFGLSGANILDNSTFTSDGSTINIITSANYADDLQSIVTIAGQEVDHVVVDQDGKAIITLGDPANSDDEIAYTIFNANVDSNVSEISVQTVTADGSSVAYDLASAIQGSEPYEWNTVVIAGDRLLDPGYVQRFVIDSTTKDYVLDTSQFDNINVPNYELRVMLGDVVAEHNVDYTWVPETGTITFTNEATLVSGTELAVFVRHNEDYRFGDYNSSQDFESDNNTVTFDATYAVDTDIQIITFNNHTHRGIDWQRIIVKDRQGLAENSLEYKKLSNIQRGKIELDAVAYDSQYVWVSKNGVLLVPNGDYYLDHTMKVINITTDIAPNDEFIAVHFAADPLIESFGWQQFKDILNKTHYQSFDSNKAFTLSNPLNWYDKRIVLDDASSLTTPSTDGAPGVVWIDGERIEYFVKDENSLSQLTRGTLGTGIKEVYSEGNSGIEISNANNIPYKDEIYTTRFTADGTSSSYTLDFTPTSIDQFEVFVAGKRMRKTTLDVYQFENATALDSPEGDITMPADFSITNNILTLTNTPIENTSVVVVRKKGRTWSDPNTSLAESNTDVAKFLRSTTVDLP